MRKWIGAVAATTALLVGTVGAPAATAAANDFQATCAVDSGVATFTPISSTKGAWYAYVWRTGYSVNGYGYVWVPAGDSTPRTGLTPQGTITNGSTRFGVVRGLLSTKYSYVTCPTP